MVMPEKMASAVTVETNIISATVGLCRQSKTTFAIARIDGLVRVLDIAKGNLVVMDVGEGNLQEQLKHDSDYQHLGWEFGDSLVLVSFFNRARHRTWNVPPGVSEVKTEAMTIQGTAASR